MNRWWIVAGSFLILSGPAVAEAEDYLSSDFDRNGRVDFLDYLTFAKGLAANGPQSDLNGDGLVDRSDYTLFRQQFDQENALGKPVHAAVQSGDLRAYLSEMDRLVNDRLENGQPQQAKNLMQIGIVHLPSLVTRDTERRLAQEAAQTYYFYGRRSKTDHTVLIQNLKQMADEAGVTSARLWMARLSILLAQYDDAREQFREILDAPDASPYARKSAEAYLERLPHDPKATALIQKAIGLIEARNYLALADLYDEAIAADEAGEQGAVKRLAQLGDLLKRRRVYDDILRLRAARGGR